MAEPLEQTIAWSWNGAEVILGQTRLGSGPRALLLPALSSISTRAELRAAAGGASRIASRRSAPTGRASATGRGPRSTGRRRSSAIFSRFAPPGGVP